MTTFDTYPVPPEDLRWRVVGNRNAEAFLRSSVNIATFFDTLLAQAGTSMAAVDSILDFGCGCGRILRALPAMTKARLTGCDIDAEAVSWCQEHLPFARCYHTGEYPPLPFEDNAFDFIYGLSVLTHLDEKHQFRWLEELKRLARPGAALILTFKGAFHLDRLKKPTIRNRVEHGLDTAGFYFKKTKFWKGIFPSYYHDAYHTADYVHKNWAPYFEILHIDVPPGATGQYSVLMRAY